MPVTYVIVFWAESLFTNGSAYKPSLNGINSSISAPSSQAMLTMNNTLQPSGSSTILQEMQNQIQQLESHIKSQAVTISALESTNSSSASKENGGKTKVNNKVKVSWML